MTYWLLCLCALATTAFAPRFKNEKGMEAVDAGDLGTYRCNDAFLKYIVQDGVIAGGGKIWELMWVHLHKKVSIDLSRGAWWLTVEAGPLNSHGNLLLANDSALDAPHYQCLWHNQHAVIQLVGSNKHQGAEQTGIPQKLAEAQLDDDEDSGWYCMDTNLEAVIQGAMDQYPNDQQRMTDAVAQGAAGVMAGPWIVHSHASPGSPPRTWAAASSAWIYPKSCAFYSDKLTVHLLHSP